MSEATQFDRAIKEFDRVNAEDPREEEVDGESVPHEWIDARRVSGWVNRLCPEASEALRLASRCQHIRRWEIPRDDYPRTRAGYLKWRQDLKQFHSETAASILREVGYGEELVTQVQNLNMKKGLGNGGEVQVLEDALCLTFLEFEFGRFLNEVSEERMIGILRKTWMKMSSQGRAEALALALPPAAARLIQKALLTGS